VLRLRLSPTDLAHKEAFGAQFENGLQTRLREADEFYSKVIPPSLSSDEKLVMRQAFAGMLWSKQFYYYPVAKWLSDPVLPPDCRQRVAVRNKPWFHLVPIPLM
jgi:hypothetical protein